MGSVSHHKISTRLIIFLMLAAGTGLEPGAVTAITITTTDAMLEATQTTIPADMTESVLGSSSSSDNGIDEPTVSEKSDLTEAETKDPQKLEIIKQIRKYNNDGSYTVGYEAEDGTFKIESRDVLGNIKGTYGYIDEHGEIQRVSYNAHNSTGIKAVMPPPVTEEVVHIPPRFNRSHIGAPTTRRPAAYHSSTSIPQRTSVIQTIPRKRPHTSTSTTERPTSRMVDTTASYVEQTTASSHSTSFQTSKPLLIIRPTPLPLSAKTIEQLARPEKLESEHISKIYPKASPLRQKEPEKKAVRGNFLRRQLPQESEEEQFEAQQQVVYGQSAGEEIANLFHSTTPGLRPVFSTTPAPRIPAAVLAARQRAAHIQAMLTERPVTTTERVYAKPPRKQEPAPPVYEPATEPSSENTYVTDTPVSVVQIPANTNREVTETAEDERRVYRQQRPIEFRPRDGYRYQAAQDRQERYRVPLGIPPQARFQGQEQQYLREPTQIPGGRGLPIAPENYPADDEVNNIAYRQQRRPQGPPPPQYTQTQQEPPTANNVPNAHSYPQQSYPVPYPYNPYNRNPYQSPVSPYYDFPERPLTTRDFERILQLLIFRHQQVQQQQAFRFGGYSNPYYGGPSAAPPFLPNPYGPAGGYQAQIPRPPFYNAPPTGAGYFDPRYQNPLYSPTTASRQYSGAGQQQLADYQQQPQQQQPDHQGAGYDISRLAPRRRQFVPRIDHDYQGSGVGGPAGQQQQQQQQELIPADVREDLLYRMLMLAIQSEGHGTVGAAFGGAFGGGFGGGPFGGLTPAGSVPRPQTTSAATPNYSKKPVRSVQILGEE